MTNSLSDTQLERIIHNINCDAKLINSWQLTGGVSAQVTGLEIALPDGQRLKMILRQHGKNDRAANPRIADDEFKLLQHLKSAALPVPTPLYVDHSNTVLETPYIVIEFIDGKTDFTPTDLSDFLQQFARTLATIHRIEGVTGTLSFLPIIDDLYTDKFSARSDDLNGETDEAKIRAVLASTGPLNQHNPSVVLHGDYWAGNVLWRDGQLVAVIDWEDAAIGDALVDVTNSRLEILWAFGVEAMQQFTHDYHSINPIDFSNLPYWDLYAALLPTDQFADWAAGWIDFRRPDVTGATLLAGHQWFVQNALKQIAR